MTNIVGESSPSEKRSTLWRELLWLIPVTAATIFLVTLVVSVSDGGTVAAVIGVVLAVLGIAISYALHRVKSRGRPVLSERRVGVWWHVASYTTSAVLLAFSVAWTASNDDDPDRYFGSTLRVGINGELPGWSLATGSDYKGFDIELVEYLKARYEVEHIQWVRLNQDERSHQWDRTLDTEPVDIVVSAFSITASRLADFDMAGPYYIDVAMAFRNGDKPKAHKGEVLRGCAVKGTTGQNRLTEVQDRLTDDLGATMLLDEPAELSECYKRFFASGDTKYIASDWSIIRAFNQATELVEAADDGVPILRASEPAEVPMPPEGGEARQLYGVALRPGHPKVCRDLTEKLNDFLKYKWTEVYGSNLGSKGLVEDWHKPQSADPKYCDYP
ncbi:transporter substrate-binding domain-containing protein [Actinosynnema sp. NPDC059335]|uniref:transporter substrate-binding domain-containing protein n=1 Tax=Actinosynnema sp. NPDC059335 TaxID=3346804 RepID=UPI00366D5045